MRIYLKLATVRGDSKAKEHVGWIEVDSASFGVVKELPSETAGKSTPTVHEMKFTKHPDSSTPTLFRMASGQDQPQPATVDFVDNDGDVYLRFQLSDAVISGYAISSSSGFQSTESFDLNFLKMTTTRFTADTTTEALEVLHQLLFALSHP